MNKMASAHAAPSATVLRIKRKRTDDPLNALVVHNLDVKKTKVLDGDQKSDTNNLFRYSGTVDDTLNDTTKHVVKNFQTIYQQVVSHDGATGRRKVNRREVKQAHQKLSRYRIVSEKRTNITDSTVSLPFLEEENELERMYRIYDVVAHDDGDNTATTNGDVGDNIQRDEEKILCNNVEMIREKLHISSNARSMTEENEYVYDLYLAPGGAIVMGDNQILNVEECHKDDYEYTYDCNENTEEYYDDEDDENDEDNWRNEYPEDDSHSSDSEEGDESGASSGDEDFVYSRYRQGKGRLQFDPYAADLQEEYYYTVADDDPDDET